jgi:predicted site-specific integrase-resolvase
MKHGKTETRQGRRLVRIHKAKEAGLPVSAATLYNWRHRGRFPSIFVQIGRAVCVDLDEFDEVFPTTRRTADQAG